MIKMKTKLNKKNIALLSLMLTLSYIISKSIKGGISMILIHSMYNLYIPVFRE